MTLVESLQESWDKQAACLLNLTTLMNDNLLTAKPSEDGWDIAYHLCHVHSVRLEWYKALGGTVPEGMEHLFTGRWPDLTAVYDLPKIVQQLKMSQQAIRDHLGKAFEGDQGPSGPYQTPADFYAHMVWHEGYHFGLIMLAMRLAGLEPAEQWEESNVWANFREEES